MYHPPLRPKVSTNMVAEKPKVRPFISGMRGQSAHKGGNSGHANRKTDVYKRQTIYVSAGKIGCQIEIRLEDLKKIIRIETADLTI